MCRSCRVQAPEQWLRLFATLLFVSQGYAWVCLCVDRLDSCIPELLLHTIDRELVLMLPRLVAKSLIILEATFGYHEITSEGEIPFFFTYEHERVAWRNVANENNGRLTL